MSLQGKVITTICRGKIVYQYTEPAGIDGSDN